MYIWIGLYYTVSAKLKFHRDLQAYLQILWTQHGYDNGLIILVILLESIASVFILDISLQNNSRNTMRHNLEFYARKGKQQR